MLYIAQASLLYPQKGHLVIGFQKCVNQQLVNEANAKEVKDYTRLVFNEIKIKRRPDV